MSKNLHECIHILKAISKIKNSKLRKQVLENLDGQECIYDAMREIAVNICNGNVKLSPKSRNKLLNYQKLIKDFKKRAKSKPRRKRLLIQSGGFLPYLIPVVLSLISALRK